MLPQITWMSVEDTSYPESLRQSTGRPRRLSYIGSPACLAGRCVSIIGSRKMSLYGERVARIIVPQLARSGLTVVSGLAYGVDGFVHRLALENGAFCAAVLGSGLQNIYPAANLPLARSIIEAGGCLLSEYEPNAEPLKHHFPERNRIVAGISPVTLIIEAGEKSGTLITARQALEAGREVGVIPGDITHLQSAGVHKLLKEGAKPITCAGDILNLYDMPMVSFSVKPALTGSLATLYDLISSEGRSVEWLCENAPFTVPELQGLLSVLELEGYIRAKTNQWLKTS